MQTINNKQTCALCQFYDWLIRRNIRVIDSWLLLSPPAGGGSAAWWWLRPVLRRLCVTERLVSGYSLLPPPSPPTLSRIMDHKTALTRARGGRVTGRLNALWSSCNVTCQQLMNLQWCTYIGQYNSSRYDSIRYTQYRFRYDTDPIIVRSLFLTLMLVINGGQIPFVFSARTLLLGCLEGNLAFDNIWQLIRQIYQNWTCNMSEMITSIPLFPVKTKNMYQLNMNVPRKTCIRYMSSCSLMFCHVFMPYFMQRKH